MSNTTSNSRLYEAYSTHTPAVVRELCHEALRHFTAVAAATVTVTFVMVAMGMGDYTIAPDYEQFGSDIVIVSTLLVITLSLLRGYARKTERPVGLATLATAAAYTAVMAAIVTSHPTPTPDWIFYSVAFVVFAVLILPSVAVAAWVLGATRRPEAA